MKLRERNSQLIGLRGREQVCPVRSYDMESDKHQDCDTGKLKADGAPRWGLQDPRSMSSHCWRGRAAPTKCMSAPMWDGHFKTLLLYRQWSRWKSGMGTLLPACLVTSARTKIIRTAVSLDIKNSQWWSSGSVGGPLYLEQVQWVLARADCYGALSGWCHYEGSQRTPATCHRPLGWGPGEEPWVQWKILIFLKHS